MLGFTTKYLENILFIDITGYFVHEPGKLIKFLGFKWSFILGIQDIYRGSEGWREVMFSQ